MRPGKSAIYGIVISVMLLVLLCACAPSASSTTSTATSKIKIGIIGPMQYTPGIDAWDAADLAAQEINKSGGIKVKGTTYEIELVKCDSNDYASVPDAVSAFERLATLDKVNFIVGGFRSEATLAQQELMKTYKMIYLNTGSASPELTKRVKKDYDKYKYYFRANGVSSMLAMDSVSATMAVGVNAAKDKLGVSKPKVGLIMQKAAYVDVMIDPVKAMIEKIGGEVVGVWRPAATAPSLVAEYSAAKDAGAHVVYMNFDGPAGVVANKEWGSMKFPFINVQYNSDAGNKSHWEATNGFCEYTAGLSYISRSAITPTNVAFWDSYVKKYDRYPSTYSATHSAIYVLKAAIEKAGTLDADTLVSEIEKTDLQTSWFRQAFMGMDTDYPHDTVMKPGYATGYIVQWIKGELVPVWPDGKPLPTSANPESWTGLKYSSTYDFQVAPWIIEYWKGK